MAWHTQVSWKQDGNGNYCIKDTGCPCRQTLVSWMQDDHAHTRVMGRKVYASPKSACIKDRFSN
eukprot:scaffold209394_cov17-Tisochrysis_lutea.AAC.1